MMFSLLIVNWLAAPLYLQIGGVMSAIFIVGATAISFHYLFSRVSARFNKWLTPPDKPKVVEPPLVLEAQSLNTLVKKSESQESSIKKKQTILLKPICIQPIFKKEGTKPPILDRVINVREIVETYDVQDRDSERVIQKKQRQFKIEKKTQSSVLPTGVLRLRKESSIEPIKIIQPELVLREEAIVKLSAEIDSPVDKNEVDPIPVTNIREAIVFETNVASPPPPNDRKQEPSTTGFPLILNPSVHRFSPVINLAMYPLHMKGKSYYDVVKHLIRPQSPCVSLDATLKGRQVGIGRRQVGVRGKNVLQDKKKVPKAHTVLVSFSASPKPLIFQLQNRGTQLRMPSWNGSRSLASIARTTFKWLRK